MSLQKGDVTLEELRVIAFNSHYGETWVLRGDFLGAHPQAVPEVGLGYFGSEEVICAIEYQ